MSPALIKDAVAALPNEKVAALCESLNLPQTVAALTLAIHRHMKFWNKLVEVCGAEFAMALGETVTVPNQARSAPAASDPDPKASACTEQNWIREDYRKDPRFALDDAQRALGFLHDIVGNLPPGRGDLSGIYPENMSGFLRLVMAQFPMA